MSDVVHTEWEDILRTEGIFAKGYGLLPKAAMLDESLSLTAKAIYAFFCSLAGNGETSFPGRDTIISRLKISKTSYYPALDQLKAANYIHIEREHASHGQFPRNVYTIVSNPKNISFDEQIAENSDELCSTISLPGIYKYGYGMISRMVMFDERISAKAKGLYAYFASYTGAGTVAFPSRRQMVKTLGTHKDALSKYMKELVSADFIHVAQQHDGKFRNNRYYIIDKPDELAALKNAATGKIIEFVSPEAIQRPENKDMVKHQCPKNKDMVKQQCPENKDMVKHQCPENKDMAEEQCPENKDMVKKQENQAFYEFDPYRDIKKQRPENEYTENESPGNEYPENQDTTNNSLTSNSFTNNTLTNINQSIYPQAIPFEQSKPHWIDLMDKKILREQILYQLGFDDFEIAGRPTTADAVESLVSLVVNALSPRRPTIRIGGEDKPRNEVADVLMELDYCHYEYVIEMVGKQTSTIKNLAAYYLTCLFTAKENFELYMNRTVQQDMLQYRNGN